MLLAHRTPARAAIFLIAILTLLALLLLSGCASGNRRVDSDVTAFSRWSAAPAQPGSRYRFERLPSQQPQTSALSAPSTLPPQMSRQNRVEAAAQTALARVGLVRSESAGVPFSVQVAFTTRVLSPRYSSFPGDANDGVFFGGMGFAGPGLLIGGGSRGASIGLSFPLFYPFPERAEFVHELTLVIRDLASGSIVFETRAAHDSFVTNGLAVLAAMLEAALRGFPEPPPGLQRLSVEVPPPG